MRAIFAFLILIALTVAAPQWNGVFIINGDTVDAAVTVTGESPLRIAIPSGAVISGAEYADGVAVFDESFNYTYSAKDLLANSDGQSMFLFTFEQPQDFGYSISLQLGAGQTIESTSPSAEYATDGKTISARWSDSGRDARFIAKYGTMPIEAHTYVIHPGMPAIDGNMFLPGLLLAFFFGYFLAAGAATTLFQRMKQITAGTSDDEKRILGALHDGPLEQAAIQQKLGFSKAKLSRTLREMEERKIINKAPQGKTNLISLK